MFVNLHIERVKGQKYACLPNTSSRAQANLKIFLELFRETKYNNY
jgi:hypothetical protein